MGEGYLGSINGSIRLNCDLPCRDNVRKEVPRDHSIQKDPRVKAVFTKIFNRHITTLSTTI